MFRWTRCVLFSFPTNVCLLQRLMSWFVIKLLCVGVGRERKLCFGFWKVVIVSVKPHLHTMCLPDNHKLETVGVFTSWTTHFYTVNEISQLHNMEIMMQSEASHHTKRPPRHHHMLTPSKCSFNAAATVAAKVNVVFILAKKTISFLLYLIFGVLLHLLFLSAKVCLITLFQRVSNLRKWYCLMVCCTCRCGICKEILIHTRIISLMA